MTQQTYAETDKNFDDTKWVFKNRGRQETETKYEASTKSF